MKKLAARLDENVRNAVVIGGGVLGLEIADSLLTRQIKTTVLEAANQLFPGRLSAGDAESLLGRLNALANLQILCGQSVESIGDNRVILKDGTAYPADAVIMATGSLPDLTLARSAGLECGRGVKVNEFMQSSDADIFAAGDTAEFNGRCFNLYMDAMASGKIAGANAAGAKTAFTAKTSPMRLMALGEKLQMA
jgi:nitrite reductase (NADH) large subunit